LALIPSRQQADTPAAWSSSEPHGRLTARATPWHAGTLCAIPGRLPSPPTCMALLPGDGDSACPRLLTATADGSLHAAHICSGQQRMPQTRLPIPLLLSVQDMLPSPASGLTLLACSSASFPAPAHGQDLPSWQSTGLLPTDRGVGSGPPRLLLLRGERLVGALEAPPGSRLALLGGQLQLAVQDQLVVVGEGRRGLRRAVVVMLAAAAAAGLQGRGTAQHATYAPPHLPPPAMA